ncbi:MAG: FecR domain-containing protein [Rhizomicrobium sp.]
MTADPSNAADTQLRRQARAWLARLTTGKAADLAAFEAWRADPAHAAAFEEERRLWRSLAAHRAAFAAGLPAVLPRRRRLWLPIGAMAVTLMLCVLTLGQPLLWLEADRITGPGEIAPVTLPDGSLAMLNTNSALAIDFRSGRRDVALLRGEAWFSVRHNAAHPFRVTAAGGEIRDVGTAFDIRRDAGGRVTVAVTAGEVAVGNAGIRAHAHAGEILRYGAGTAPHAGSGNIAALSSWRSGRVVIDGRSLGDAVDELARYRPGVVFLLSSKASQKVSGNFRISAIDQGLEGLAAARGLTVTYFTPFVVVLR